jgi:hypothetical protein
MTQNATWEDLVREIYVRKVIEQWLTDATNAGQMI